MGSDTKQALGEKNMRILCVLYALARASKMRGNVYVCVSRTIIIMLIRH